MKFNIDNYEVSPHPKTKNWVYVWEPLNIDIPQTAKPYCCYASTVIFYEDDAHKVELGRNEHKITHSFLGETILSYGGSEAVAGTPASRHFFLMCGEVMWHNDAWYMRWTAHKPSAAMEESDDFGYWCQGDCVFIQATAPTTACELYRNKLSQGRIGVDSHMPSAIVNRTANEKIQRLMKVLELAEEALEEVWSMCSHEHWLKVGEALERIAEVVKTKH